MTSTSKCLRYDMAHRETRRAYAKQYYNDNKDELLAKTPCDICGKHVCKKNMHHHKKSLQCLKCNDKNDTNGKVECGICGSHVAARWLAKHQTPLSCQRANKANDSVNLKIGKTPCDVCGEYILTSNMKTHKLSKRCKKYVANSTGGMFKPIDDVLTCNVCGLKVSDDNTFGHKATVRCLTAYVSKVFDRPFNKTDQTRYDYLIQKLYVFQNKEL